MGQEEKYSPGDIFVLAVLAGVTGIVALIRGLPPIIHFPAAVVAMVIIGWGLANWMRELNDGSIDLLQGPLPRAITAFLPPAVVAVGGWSGHKTSVITFALAYILTFLADWRWIFRGPPQKG